MPGRRIAGILLGALLGGPLAPAAVDSMEQPTRERAQKQLALIDQLEKIEADQGAVSDASIPALLDLSLLYIDEDHCGDAIMMLTRAVRISRMNDGLFNTRQVELLEPLMECYLALDLGADFQREQRYTLLIGDHNFGRSNPEILPTLGRTAQWYEEAGWYLSARKLYQQAVEVARANGKDKDPSVVDPLRGIARTYRLAYMHGLDPMDMAENNVVVTLASRATRGNVSTLQRDGEESLKQAVQILRSRPEAGRELLVDTLLDLGDWYQVSCVWRDAVRVYKEALHEVDSPQRSNALFDEPVPVIYRADDIGIALRKPLKNADGFDHYWVKFNFTVTNEGAVVGLKVVESDAPDPYRWRIAEGFKRTRYRPRFIEGEPVDTLDVQFRQGLYVKK